MWDVLVFEYHIERPITIQETHFEGVLQTETCY